MEQLFSQSTPSNYYTPKNRPYTLERSSSLKSSVSTQAKCYNYEESFRQYEELLEENFILKSKLFKENNSHMNVNQNHRTVKFLLQKQNINASDHPRLMRNNSSKCMSTSINDNQWSSVKSQTLGSTSSQLNYQQSYKESDMQMWSIKHRNNFLQQKLQNLQGQFQRQSQAINEVIGSEKWKNRFDCKQSTCYQDKYIKLLRVKSPVFLD